MPELPENLVEFLNEHRGGYNTAMDLRFVQITPDEVVAEIVIGDQHRQPYGLVHGGVYAGIIETLCSTGAALHVMPQGKSAVGLENSTAFLRAVRSGTLRCTATPLIRGRRSHVWQAEIYDDQERLAATGRVRMLVLDPGAEAGGEAVKLKIQTG